MKSPATPIRLRSRHIAPLTALRLRTAASAQTRVKTESRTKAKSVMPSAFLLRRLFLVPLEMPVRHGPAHFEQALLAVDHLVPGIARQGELILQKDRLFRTDFLAHAAIDAAEHVDIEARRSLLDMIPARVFRH